MPQNWQTVAIPFAAGIKPTSRGRTLDQARLLTAQNCVFVTDEGPQKRKGHTSRAVQSDLPPPGLGGIVLPSDAPLRTPHSLENPGLSQYWVHGYGLFNSTSLATPGAGSVSNQPRAGYTFGGWRRDNEFVAWTGARALSATLTDTPFATVRGEAIMPGLRGAPIAKSLSGQTTPDTADSGVLRTAAWVHDGDVYRAVFSSSTGAPVVVESSLGLTGATRVRALTVGAWTHLVIHDDDIDEVVLRSWHQDSPNTVVALSLGSTTASSFDVRKLTESSFVVARILSGLVLFSFVGETGLVTSTYTVTPTPGGTSGLQQAVVIAISATTGGRIGLLYQNIDKEVKFTSNLLDGTSPSTHNAVITPTAFTRLTVSEVYLPGGIGVDAGWVLYVEDENPNRRVISYSANTASIVQRHLRHNVQLGSHAFRVGQRTYVWMYGAQTLFSLQPTWFLCDDYLLPVGKALFGLAYVPANTVYTLPSVNWHTIGSTPAKDIIVFCGALSYRQRGPTEGDEADPNGVWLEPSIFHYSLDFLPVIRSAQAGRSTYISGAQLWEYDGASLTEAGFHMAPEGWTVVSGGAGSLDNTKQYNWRIDLCYKNAQNEEVRSWSKTFSLPANTAGANFQAQLVIRHMPMTRRDNAYFLVFRTEGDGTEYYLVSSRDPTSSNYIANDRASSEYNFIDNTSDTSLINNEYHPANAPNYVQPLPAPACEIVAAGRDRLWLAGGELSPGEIAPSRLFQPGTTPAFSPAMNFQVDRNSEAITAIGFVGEQAVFFRETSAYAQASDGPDNVLQGDWAPPRLALSDVGAVSQESLALAGDGLYFQSPAGIRVITQGGGLRPPGAGLIGGLGTDVDTLAAEGNYAAAVVVPTDSQIRWYSRDPSKPTLVVDYTKNVWTTFTGLTCTYASYWLPGSTVLLLRGAGELWRETPGRYVDDDRTYEMVVKTAWLHGGNLGDFERVRRFALFGEASSGLSLRFRVYYDEREFYEQEEVVEFSDSDFNQSTWGQGSWGNGPWGDSEIFLTTGTSSRLYFRDGRFRFRKRLDRQKCSVFAIEFSDQGSQAEFTPVVLAIELGAKTGLDRTS